MADISTLNGYNLKDAQARDDISTIEGKIPSGASSSNKMATASDITAITEKIPSAASSSNKLVDTTAMNDAIGQAVSAAYKPAGNKTVAELTSSLLIADNRGKVYNMTDAGTTTADFVEGAGQPIRVGDDVGICEPTTGTFKFNLVSGFIAVDTNPTQGSANPVSSGGVRTEFDGIKNGQSIDSFGDVETALAGIKNGTSIDSFEDTEDALALKAGSTNMNNLDFSLETSEDVQTGKTSLSSVKLGKTQGSALYKAAKSAYDLTKDTVGFSGKNKCAPLRNTSNRNVIITTDVNGISTISGLANANGGRYDLASKVFQLKAGTYKIKINGTNTWGDALCVSKYPSTLSDNLILEIRRDSGEFTRTLTLDSDMSVVVGLTVSNGTTYNGTLSIIIEDVNVLDDTYEPYHSNVVDTLREAEVIKGKNLLPLTLESVKASTSGGSWNGNVYTNGDVAYTVTTNDAGYVTEISANGTSGGSDSYFRITTKLADYLTVGEKYTLNGCPSDGGISKYCIYTGSAGVWEDDGNGVDKEYANTITNLFIKVNHGVTVNNLKFYPMIRLATETDPTYEPFYPLAPLKDSMFPRSEQAVLGAVNILPNNAKTQSGSGITYTVNADGTVTITGTASAVTQLSNIFVANEDYKNVYLSGIPATGLNCYMTLTDVTASTDIATDIGEGTNAFNLVKGHQYNCKLISGATAVFTNPVTVSPMISLTKGQAYVPYAMPNKEMTEKILDSKIVDMAYFVHIPYNSEHQNDIAWMLTDAVSKNVFKNGKIVIGRIDPSTMGSFIGYMYYANDKWYGSVYVITSESDASNGLFICSNNTFTKRT